MTLLVAVLAAIVSTLAWYTNEKREEMKLGFLSLMFWGASLMWFIDACFEYAELGAEYFTPAVEDMLNDFYLGLSVVALGLVIWLIYLVVKDPEGKIKAVLTRKK